MANRRPIRAPRQGWRRGRRRPTRWVDCFSSNIASGASGAIGGGSISPGVDTGIASSYRELVVGDLDTEWADANEVLVERIVGQISLSGTDTDTTIADIGSLPGRWGFLIPAVRLGLVVVEDVDDSSGPLDLPALFNADDLQDAEWMWLFQLGSPNETHLAFDTSISSAVRTWTHDVHLDVRVKRKLGRRDRLVLVQEWAVRATAFGDSHTVGVHPLLRCVVSTK